MEGTPEQPIYKKVRQSGPVGAPEPATTVFMVTCDEGWRSSIVCTDMYEWAADWLVEQIQGKPFAPGTRP